ncbi:MAG: HRDC domain-containing protein [Methanobacteriota archaeon]
MQNENKDGGAATVEMNAAKANANGATAPTGISVPAGNSTQNGASQTQSTSLQTVVVSGECTGYFRYGDVEREFSGNHVVLVRTNGGIIIHSAQKGIKPVCYIEEGADIALARNMADAEVEISAIAEDGREILVTFSKVRSISGLAATGGPESVDRAILMCVQNANGMYGRHTVSRILTGSASKKVLTLKLSTLALYGALADVPFKDVLDSVDSLIEQGLIEIREREEFKVLWLTESGEKALADAETPAEPEQSANAELLQALKDWRRDVAKARHVPSFMVLQNRTLADIAARKPTTAEDLSKVYGIGRTRLANYGPELLDMVRQHAGANPAA